MTAPLGATPHLVLASGSPRRRELLLSLGLKLDVRPAEIDETPRAQELPAAYVLRLAEEKAQAVATAAGEVVLAADTTVVIDAEILGKPGDQETACRMLAALAGRSHRVFTGVAVWDPTRDLRMAAVESTDVRFAPMTAAEISWYAASGEPLDRAGAYAIQGLGSLFVEAIVGNYSNVMGLPIPLTRRLLMWAGFPGLGPTPELSSREQRRK